ncbi:MAG: competence/damage-inducible protein A [Polyangiaceae bacterium]|nr:competence/damage-inducible protein A [Polyangiaceae bacterium]
MRTAAALIIGNELLSGKIADSNIVVLARALRSLGIVFRRVVMVLDEIDVIADEVRTLSSSHDFLFTSGGVGPTHDDVTIDAVARSFGVEAISSPAMVQMLREYYGDRLTEGHLRMARIPEGARLASNPHMPWPAIIMHNVWVLPGVPEIFQAKMPLVRELIGSDKPFVSFAVYTTLDEGTLKPMLDEVVRDHTDVEIGSYPRWGGNDYRTKLTFDGVDAERVGRARDAFASSLPAESIVKID